MANCKWHKNEEPIQDGETVGCPDCGRLIATKICSNCGQEFLDWAHRGYDDIIAGPAATSNGDFCCRACLPGIEREIERQDEEDSLEFGFDYDI